LAAAATGAFHSAATSTDHYASRRLSFDRVAAISSFVFHVYFPSHFRHFQTLSLLLRQPIYFPAFAFAAASFEIASPLSAAAAAAAASRLPPPLRRYFRHTPPLFRQPPCRHFADFFEMTLLLYLYRTMKKKRVT